MSYLPVILLWALVVIPLWRILQRMGFAPAWSLLAFVPIANLVALWWLARAPWPVTTPPAPATRP